MKTKLAMPSPSACQWRKQLRQNTLKCLTKTSTKQVLRCVVSIVGNMKAMSSSHKCCDESEDHAVLLLIHNGQDPSARRAMPVGLILPLMHAVYESLLWRLSVPSCRKSAWIRHLQMWCHPHAPFGKVVLNKHRFVQPVQYV